ncbi:coproporphyrinogen-III oxidase family protein [Deinococcus ruber]|uniref:Heme chaperone HemW n=1 Tax=Deinococcus ruber TaxID=1848197 RepID=A0A918CI21_9DEIO|nr:coproporphyrinogen-III oxidase family protein [Deinococcus ruber]GGR22716.1 coproporphyrinogen III oxidase [Deinococcus ruber]
MNARPPSAVIRHAYIHVPFCPSICPYCDFHVLERRGDQVARYLTRLDEEARELGQRYDVQLETLYLGGGTPSFLRDDEMKALVASVRAHLGWGRLENTLEINPGTVSPARAALWRELGFDRASVGIQSLDDATLRFLGRQHTAQTARDAVTELLAAGFRVSGDLITAVAGQPLERDIEGLVALGVEHVSAYTLTIEPGTPFARRGVEVDEDDERRGFEQTETLLTGAGFERYEISNYARTPGAHSRHNRAYWTGEYFLGLGPGGAGFYPPIQSRDAPTSQDRGQPLPFRRTNPHLHEWLTGAQGEAELLSPGDVATDSFFMGLRLREGVHLPTVSRRSGLDVLAHYGEVIDDQIGRGLLERSGEYLRATPQGWWQLNSVVAALMERDSEAETLSP